MIPKQQQQDVQWTFQDFKTARIKPVFMNKSEDNIIEHITSTPDKNASRLQ